MPKSQIAARALTCLLLLNLALSSCATVPEQSPLGREVIEDPVLSASQLRMFINEFVVQFRGRTEEASDEILEMKLSPEITRRALQWKIYAIPAIFRAASFEDPLAATLDSWILAKQIVYFFESDAGHDLFGDAQTVALNAARVIEEEISIIATTIGAKDESVSKIEAWADSLARENPLNNIYFTRSSFLRSYIRFMEEDGAGLFKSVTQLTESLSEFEDLFIMYAEYLPNQARWQVELLFMDFRLGAGITNLEKKMSNVALAVRQLSEVNKDLPAKLDEQKDALIADLDREWNKALSDIDELRIDTFDRITGERVAVIEAMDQEVKLVLEQITAERETTLRDIEAVSLRITEELLKKSTETADHLLMKAFWLAVALAVIVFVLVMVGAMVLRKGRQEKA